MDFFSKPMSISASNTPAPPNPAADDHLTTLLTMAEKMESILPPEISLDLFAPQLAADICKPLPPPCPLPDNLPVETTAYLHMDVFSDPSTSSVSSVEASPTHAHAHPSPEDRLDIPLALQEADMAARYLLPTATDSVAISQPPSPPPPALAAGLPTSHMPYNAHAHMALPTHPHAIPVAPPVTLPPAQPTYLPHTFPALPNCAGSAETAESSLTTLHQATRGIKKARKTTRKPKTYSKPVASRFCHICSRMPRRGQGSATCRRMAEGYCRKIVCEQCVREQGWDFNAIKRDMSDWLCPHCADACPPRSQCHIYNRVNARRKRVSAGKDSSMCSPECDRGTLDHRHACALPAGLNGASVDFQHGGQIGVVDVPGVQAPLLEPPPNFRLNLSPHYTQISSNSVSA